MNNEIQKWAKQNSNVYWIDGTPWIKESVFLIPLNMPHAVAEVNRAKLKKVLKASGALIARWTSNWDCKETGWWYTCCDDERYSIDKINNSRGKRGVKKGLKNCEVRKVEVDEFIVKAYPIYKEALISYGVTPPSLDIYSNDIINKVKGVNRVVYDISSKPPATIEWE